MVCHWPWERQSMITEIHCHYYQFSVAAFASLTLLGELVEKSRNISLNLLH